jgi:hypothetical protein
MFYLILEVGVWGARHLAISRYHFGDASRGQAARGEETIVTFTAG